MKLLFFTLMFFFSPILAHACKYEYVFDIGSKAIEAKYPEWDISPEKFEVKEFEKEWMIVRKEYVYQERPKEYPRALISKKECQVKRIFWSK